MKWRYRLMLESNRLVDGVGCPAIGYLTPAIAIVFPIARGLELLLLLWGACLSGIFLVRRGLLPL